MIASLSIKSSPDHVLGIRAQPQREEAQRKKQLSSPNLGSIFKGPFSVQLLPGNIYLFRDCTWHPQGCDLDLWPNWAIALKSITVQHQHISHKDWVIQSLQVGPGRALPKPVQPLCIILSPLSSNDHACPCLPVSFRSQLLYSSEQGLKRGHSHLHRNNILAHM